MADAMIIGHEYVLQAFERLVARGMLGHAYLLIGPAHVGKTTIARWLAARMLCTERAPPCDVCAPCTNVVRGTHPDCFVMDADRSVDAVRAWTAALSCSSLFSGWKVGIMEGCDAISEHAANACLKFLEEPPPRTVLLLTATSARGVLSTIASRCAVVRVPRVPSATIAQALEERGIASGDTHTFADIALGCPGVAVALARDVALAEQHATREAALAALVDLPIAERLRCIEGIAKALPEDRAAAREETERIVHALGAIARSRVRSNAANARAFLRVLQSTVRAPILLGGNVAPRLVLESLVLALPS